MENKPTNATKIYATGESRVSIVILNWNSYQGYVGLPAIAPENGLSQF